MKLPAVNPSDVIATVALLVAGGSAWYTRRTWKAADWANKLSEERRRDEVKPQLESDVVHGGDGGILEVISRGPQDYDLVRFHLIESSAKQPVTALLVDGTGTTEGSLGPLARGQELRVPVVRDHQVGGTMRLLVTCSNGSGAWDVLIEHEFLPPPMVF